MRTITYYLATNQVVESDAIYPNAFSADDNTTQLVFDFTGTACATWDKWLDLTMSDYTKDVQSLGTGTVVTFNLGAEHTKKGLLQVNPYAKSGTDKHGFPIYKLTIERQLNNSTVDASAQQSMIDYFDDRLTVKAVSATTLAPGESATASVTTEADGTTYVFGIPQGAQGIQGIQGVKGAQWRGAYSAGTAYVVDDVVSYNGSSYICILASTGNLPTNATYWSLLAQKGDNTTASAVTNTPAGNISATTVQGAIDELDTEKADKLYATNLVTNGDFSNGTTGWTIIGSSITVDTTQFSTSPNSVLINQNGSNVRITKNIDTPVGSKFYTLLKCRKTSGTGGFAGIYDTQAIPQLISEIMTINAYDGQAIGTWVIYSSVFSSTTNQSTVSIGRIGSAVYVANFDDVFVINLTQTFGAGKEPSKEQMDNMLSTFTNSWFNGTAELVSIANLAQLKADKTQEAWITPTLLNSWNNVSGYTTRYKKDQMGVVWCEVFVTGGTNGSTIFQLPTGYRPTQQLYIPGNATGSFGTLVVVSDGTVVHNTGSNTANHRYVFAFRTN